MEERLLKWAGFICWAYCILLIAGDGLGTSLLIFWPVMGTVLLTLGYKDRLHRVRKVPLFTNTVKAGVYAFFLLMGVFSLYCIYEAVTVKANNADYLIILGAGVNDTKPSYALEKRLESAEELMKSDSDMVAVATGGLGEGDSITEGECIRNWLTEKGIEEERIIMEDSSRTTEENLLFAFEKIKEDGAADTAGIAIVTNNFHVTRAVAMGKSLTDRPYSFSGVYADFPVYLLPHYVMREFVCVVYYTVNGTLRL